MAHMFDVRPSPRLAPQSAVAPFPLHAACARGRPPPPASRPGARPAPYMPSLRPLVDREQVQSAAELRHVPRH
eukprot:scaffold26070_cov55-Phaeocystis_antarctica.AAC.2